MKQHSKILAIIPARGGSKGIPGKNIKVLAGKPLIQYAVDCALASKTIDTIVINSDDQNTLDVVNSNQSKKIIKQLRPPYLGRDNTSIVDVVINSLENLNDDFDIIILLQVTSPIRTSTDIDKIISYFKHDKKLEGVISVIPMEDIHPARMYNVDNSLLLKPLLKQDETTHRQELEPVYYRNGCFYAVRTSALKHQKSFMPNIKKAYKMNPDHLLNIDSKRDILVAETLIKAWLKNDL